MNDTPRVSVAWQVSTDPRMGAIGNWIPQPAGASASVQRDRESTLRRASAGTHPTPLIRRNHSVSVGTKSYPVTVAGSLGGCVGETEPRRLRWVDIRWFSQTKRYQHAVPNPNGRSISSSGLRVPRVLPRAGSAVQRAGRVVARGCPCHRDATAPADHPRFPDAGERSRGPAR